MKKSYGVDRRSSDKMSDSNDTLQIYKFSSDIVRCPTIILSLDSTKVSTNEKRNEIKRK